MVPTIDQYVAASIRAISEVVLPAIDKSESMALEQAQLVIGLLTLIGEQWDKTVHVEIAELRAHLELATALASIAAGGRATHIALERGRSAAEKFSGLAAITLPPQADLRAANVELRAAITEMIAAGREDGTADFRAQADKLVLEHAGRQNLLARAWFAKSRLDADWTRLPPVSELLAM